MGKTKLVIRRWLVALACSAPAACGDNADETADSGASSDLTVEPPSTNPTVKYTADIQPILVARCSPCHTTLNLGGHNAAMNYADAVARAPDIVDAIASGAMPVGMQGCNGGAPGEPGCVSADEFALIQAWVDDGMPE